MVGGGSRDVGHRILVARLLILLKTDTSKRLVLKNCGVLRVKDIELLFLPVIFVLFCCCDRFRFILRAVRLLFSNFIDSAKGSRAVHSRLNHFLVNFKRVLLVLVKVSEFTFEFAHHEHLLSVGLDCEGVTGIVDKITAYIV
jgi:hypothetical protein